MSGQRDTSAGVTVVKVTTLPEEVVPMARAESGENETFLRIALQIILPFITSGLAMVGAGVYLDHIQKWDVFQNVSEIIVLIPALLGLKGNLEMTLASRLSTEANLGTMQDRAVMWSMISGNNTLVQCQAIVIGLLASIVSVGMVIAFNHHFSLKHAILLCACSIATAATASFILGIITSIIIVASMKLNINPDNIATPIAASLGDITSLVLLSFIASHLYAASENCPMLPVLIIIFFLLLLPVLFCLAYNNQHTRSVVTSGWSPIIMAMLISTFGGMGLETTVKLFPKISVFQPLFNGVGGNLVSIQASRLSTSLHKVTQLGRLPQDVPLFPNPKHVFFSNRQYSLTSRVLMSFIIPGHSLFVLCIILLREDISFDPMFLVVYLSVATIQVATLLYVAFILTNFFWSRGVNPDNTTIPYLTALGDLLGVLLLGLTFAIVQLSS